MGSGSLAPWDTTLLKQIYTHVAAQARSRGTSVVLAPVVDVVRDPRWGRTGETLGEDPYLSGTLGSAIVEGLQGAAPTETIAPGHVGGYTQALYHRPWAARGRHQSGAR